MKPARLINKKPALTKRIVVLMLFLVVLKLSLVCYFLQDSGNLFAITAPDPAVAQEEQAEEIPPAVEPQSAPTELVPLSLLGKKQEELKQREAMLRQEEEHLNQLKAEIEKSLEGLTLKEQGIDKQMKQMASLRQTLEDEELKKLAKVFESTPPEQAGPMFDKLDVQLAAKILFRMNGRYAGKIWGYVNPDQAVLISRELSAMK